MASYHNQNTFLSYFLVTYLWIAIYHCSAVVGADWGTNQSAVLSVNASVASGRKMPSNLFGVFVEEINHACAGGLWSELVSNRGFEAMTANNTPTLDPWRIAGDNSLVNISTDNSSSFPKNKVALRMEVLCGNQGGKACPSGGVGISNPGFWGMNIVQGKMYKVSFYVRSSDSIDLSVSLTGSNGNVLAQEQLVVNNISSWTKMDFQLQATATDKNSSLQLTTSKKSVIWFDMVSVMPQDTYKGHGFRPDLFKMVQDLKPRFLRFPGGCFVEGKNLSNSLKWKETIGRPEERPGHFNDYWNYWTDDALGYLEYLQLAEDLNALPIWVFNLGISVDGDEVDPAHLGPLVQDALDGIEFAIGNANSTWGSKRAAMGHPQPFDLRYVAPGNEDCGKRNYDGNYQKAYDAIRKAYPAIKIISNCDGSSQLLTQPADIYDYHTYPNAQDMYYQSNHFDTSPRQGPKAFVSEYAVWVGNGNLQNALAESAFVMGLERNSDIVEFASYAPLFVNTNDRMWMPDAIVFDSSQAYGTPSYHMQKFLVQSNGATYLQSTLNSTTDLVTSNAILWHNATNNTNCLRVKAVNFGGSTVDFKISIDGLGQNSINSAGSIKTVLTSNDVMDENSFSQPTKVVPVKSVLQYAGTNMDVVLPPYSLTSFDLLMN